MTVRSAGVPQVGACLTDPDLQWARMLSFTLIHCDQYKDLLSLSTLGKVHLAMVSMEKLPEKQQLLSSLRAGGGLLAVVVENDQQAVDAYGLGAVEVYRRPVNPEVVDLSLRSLLAQVAEALFLLREPVQTVGDLTISLVHHTVERDGQVRHLSVTEWKLLCIFLSRPGHTFSRHELATELDGVLRPGADQVELRVSRLRSRIERDPRRPAVIETVRGAGYRLAMDTIVHEEAARLMDPTRLVHGEPSEPIAQQEAEYWRSVYEELISTKKGLLEHLRSCVEKLSPTARQELVETDVLLLESQLERYNHRMHVWAELVDAPEAGLENLQRN